MDGIKGGPATFLAKIGIPPHLFFGYLGVMVFMLGDGLELAWISPYLVEKGFSVHQAGIIASVYGTSIALASWGSGVISQSFGIRKTMVAGLLMYVIGTVCFISFGVGHLSMEAMMISYVIRGFGYPLFAYSFLLWITLRTPENRLASATGWYWFAFTGGLNVLGAYYSVIAIDKFGHIGTLWTSLAWVGLGAFLALIINRDDPACSLASPPAGSSKLAELLKGMTILKDEPKLLAAVIVRVICTTPQFAYPVFFPIYLHQKYGLTTEQWLGMWGLAFTFNMFTNVLCGLVGDRWGWQKTIFWIGSVGGGISTLLLAFAPEFSSGNHLIIGACVVLWGISMSGYIPINALTPSLVPLNKGAAISALNLGGGLPVVVGPALVTIFLPLLGISGLLILFAGMYFLSAGLTLLLSPGPVERKLSPDQL